VASHQADVRLTQLVGAPPQDFLKDIGLELAGREADDVHGGLRRRTHRVDIRQGVRCGYPTEIVGIIDDRGEKIDRLDKGKLVADPVDARVLEPLDADYYVLVGRDLDAAENIGQVLRTYFRRSAAAPRLFRQLPRHPLLSFRCAARLHRPGRRKLNVRFDRPFHHYITDSRGLPSPFALRSSGHPV
jgi:hypothetical protein